ncbi:unnamed protein product [Allacma fusca]|uniref:Insulin-degrading enzyme n=1 Tax=Allacma fusca TaxID=39272 RepID=A0A8J2P3T2_9HEXA|nr:unnamed protein product [Allacma fusca]
MTSSPPAQCWNVNRRESATFFPVRDVEITSEAFLPSGSSEINDVESIVEVSGIRDVQEERDEITEIYEDENIVLKSPLDHRQYQTLQLTNQMHVLLISDPKTSKCAASLCIQAGSMHDPKQLPGLAHFCEHLIISKKSAGEENEESFEKLVSSNGGQVHSRTRRDSTVFSFDVYPESFPKALRQFAKFFLAHCFTEEDMEQSISSINQEFEKVLVLDEERRNRIDAALCKISHPYHKFDCGSTLSLWTRPKSTSSKLRDQVMKFLQEYYSANLMHLVILGTDDIPGLQSQIETYFSLLQNAQTTLTPWSTSPYGEEHVKTKIDIVPVTNVHQLLLIFPMPDYSRFYKSGVIPYMQYIVGYEGPGSLISLLREQNWADMIVPEYRRPAKGFAIFTIDIQLTHSGLKNIYNIVHNVFQYFKLLRIQGPQRWLWQEIGIIESAKFQFQEQQSPLCYAENLATYMPEYPKHHYIAGKYLVRDYMPRLLRDFADRLVPNDLRLILSTKSNLKEANKTEEWFGINYRYSKIDRGHLKKWSNCELHGDLCLPRRSRFIPESFQIKPRDLKVRRNVPRVITEDSTSQVWFLQDHEFTIPTALITVVILSPLPRLDAMHFNSTRLIEKILNDSLTEIASDARHAGLYHKIEASLTGLTITVHGYDNKIHLYFNTVLGSLFQFCSTGKVSIRFQDIKEACRENLNNWRNEEPYIHAMEYVRELLNSHTWNPEQLLLALNEDLDPNKLMYFCQEFLRKIRLQWFLYGNLTEYEAHRIYQTSVKYFDSFGSGPVTDLSLLTIQEAVLPFNSYTIYHAQHPAHVESSCVTYLQTGCGEVKETILTEFVATILRQPAMEMLRTADQLVWTEVRKSKANVGFEIILQEERDPAEMESCIEEFLKNMESYVLNMSPEAFSHVKRELKLRKIEKTKSFKHSSRFLFEEILRETYNFQRNAKEILELEIITLEQVAEFYKNRITPNGSERKRITVLVASSIEKENVILLQNTSADAIEIPDTTLEKGTKSLSSAFQPFEKEQQSRSEKLNPISSAVLSNSKPQENKITSKLFESIMKTLSNMPAQMPPTAEHVKQKKSPESKLSVTKHSHHHHHHHHQSNSISSSNRLTSKTNQRPKTTGSLANSATVSLSSYRKKTLEHKLKIDMSSKLKSSKDPQSILGSRYSYIEQGLAHNRNKNNISKHNIAIRKNSVVARPATSGVSGAPFFLTDQQKNDNWRRLINKERLNYTRNLRQDSINDLPSGSKSKNRMISSNPRQLAIPREDLDFRDYDFDFEQEIRRLRNLKKYLEYDTQLKKYKTKVSKSTEDDTQNLEAPIKPHVPPEFSLQYEIRRLKTLREILDEEASLEKEVPTTIIPYSHPVRKRKTPPRIIQDNALTCTVHDVEKEIRRLINIKKYFDGEIPNMNLHNVEYTVFVISEIKLDHEDHVKSILQSKLAQQTQARVSSKNPHLSPIQLNRNSSNPPSIPPPKNGSLQEVSPKTSLPQGFKSKMAAVPNTSQSVEPVFRVLRTSEDIQKRSQHEVPTPILKKPQGKGTGPVDKIMEVTFQQLGTTQPKLQKAKSLSPLEAGRSYRSTMPFMHFSLSYGPNHTLSEVTRAEKRLSLGAGTLPRAISPYGALGHTYPNRFNSNSVPTWTLPKKTENILRIMDIRLGNYTSIRKHFKDPDINEKRILSSVAVARARARNSKRSMLSGGGIVNYSLQKNGVNKSSKVKILNKKRSSKSVESSINASENSKHRKSLEKLRLKISEERVKLRKSDEKVRLRKSEERVRLRKSEDKVRLKKSEDKMRLKKSEEKVRLKKSEIKVRLKKSEDKVHKKSNEKVRQKKSDEKVVRIKLEGRNSKINLQKMESINKKKSRSSITTNKSKKSLEKVLNSFGKASNKQSIIDTTMKVPFEGKEKIKTPEVTEDKSHNDANETPVDVDGVQKMQNSLNPTVPSNIGEDVEIFPEAPSPPSIEVPPIVIPKLSIPTVNEPSIYIPESQISQIIERLEAAISESVVPVAYSLEHLNEITGTSHPSIVDVELAVASSPLKSGSTSNIADDTETHAALECVQQIALDNLDESQQQNEVSTLEVSPLPSLGETSSETRNMQGRHGKRRLIAECHTPDLRKWMRQVVVKEMQHCIKSLANKSFRKFAKSSNVSSHASNVSLLPVLYHLPATVSSLHGKANSAMHLRTYSSGKIQNHTQPLAAINRMQRQPSALLDQHADLEQQFLASRGAITASYLEAHWTLYLNISLDYWQHIRVQ